MVLTQHDVVLETLAIAGTPTKAIALVDLACISISLKTQYSREVSA